MSTKCFNVHITEHLHISENGIELFNKPVEFVWIQGVVTAAWPESNQFNLDDGTSSLLVISSGIDDDAYKLRIGDYVLVQGSVNKGEDELTGQSMVAIEARIVSPIQDPNMESLWFLEVKDAIVRSARS